MRRSARDVFEAEKRGAARVLATDYFCWGGPGWGTRAGFDLAHRLLNSKVEAKEIDIPDISPETVGVFDIVLFLARANAGPRNRITGIPSTSDTSNPSFYRPSRSL